MPAFLAPILAYLAAKWPELVLQVVLPWVIKWLKKEGELNAAEALGARGAVAIVAEVKSIEFEDSFPTSKNGSTETPIIQNAESNINKS